MHYHWNWPIFWEISPDGVHTYLQTLLMGTGWTLLTAAFAFIIALTFGSLIGVMRTTPFGFAVRIGDVYVELFRNIPLLVQMFLWYFVLPELVPRNFGNWLKQLPNASFYTAVVALGLYMSARIAGAGGGAQLAARPAAGRFGARTYTPADLRLRAAADGLPHHHAAAHVGIAQYH